MDLRFKESCVFPDNKAPVFKRTLNTVHRLKRDPDTLEQFCLSWEVATCPLRKFRICVFNLNDFHFAYWEEITTSQLQILANGVIITVKFTLYFCVFW